MRDAKLAVETGVDGLDVVIGTSSFLREHSHGKDMAYIEKTAIEVIEYIKSKGLEVRCELAKTSGLWDTADTLQSPARIPSAPTSSTFSPTTVLSTRSALTALGLPTPLAAPPPARSTTYVEPRVPFLRLKPLTVFQLVRTLRGVVSCDIETHFHNDTGCSIANAYCALEAGATHIDTSVLGSKWILPR